MLATTPGGGSAKQKVKELLAAGANPDACCNIFGNRPLHETGHFDNSVVASALIKAGADVNAENGNQDTPLHLAGCNGAADVAKLLIKAAARLDVLNSFQETPLHQATESGSVKVVKLLLQAGADPDIKNENGNTPLEVICRKHCPEGARKKIINLLVEVSGSGPYSHTAYTHIETNSVQVLRCACTLLSLSGCDWAFFVDVSSARSVAVDA